MVCNLENMHFLFLKSANCLHFTKKETEKRSRGKERQTSDPAADTKATNQSQDWASWIPSKGHQELSFPLNKAGTFQYSAGSKQWGWIQTHPSTDRRAPSDLTSQFGSNPLPQSCKSQESAGEVLRVKVGDARRAHFCLRPLRHCPACMTVLGTNIRQVG